MKHNYPKRTIQELNNQYQGETVFIVGTGPSMRLFPVDLLAGKITIGLNQAWKLFRPTYLLTIHPEVLPPNTRTTHIITKEKGNLTGQEPYIFFRNNKDVTDFSYLTALDDRLYIGRGIHTGAMTLAARMGARWCFLVGCDFWPLGGDHHCLPDHHVQMHGLSSEEVYREYYVNARELRLKLEKDFEIKFLSLNPFLGVNIEEDYCFRRVEKGLNIFSVPRDTSNYLRDKPDFTS